MWKENINDIFKMFEFVDVNECPLCKNVKCTQWDSNTNKNIQSLQCENCKLIFSNKILSDTCLKKFYNGYNNDRTKKSQLLDLQREIMYIKDKKYIYKLYGSRPKGSDEPSGCEIDSILDIGCGNGDFLNMFTDSHIKYGFDLDTATKSHDSINLIHNLNNLPNDIKFDVIIFRGTIQYIRNLKHIKHIIDKHISKSGIIAILATPNGNSPAATLLKNEWSLYNPIEHITLFNLQSIQHLFNNYEIFDQDFPYLNSPYSNEQKDLDNFANAVSRPRGSRPRGSSPKGSSNKQISFPFWGSIMNLGLKNKTYKQIMFNDLTPKGFKKTYVIAEIGINHNGDVNLAKQLMDESKKAGADCVKFQKRVVDDSFTKSKLDEPYNTPNSWGETYGLHKHHLEFSEQELKTLRDYANILDIDFASTGCDYKSVDFLDTLDMKFFKTASGDITNLPLLKKVASKNKPFIISTGMTDIKTLKHVVNELNKINTNFAILICTSTYPCPFEDIHLNNLETFRHEFPNKVIGYSGHEKGFIPTLAAVSKGAKIVERHVTLDKTMRGSDHKGSIEPNELKELIDAIHIIEQSLGTHVKEIRNSEIKGMEKLTKSLCSNKNMKKGHILSIDDIIVKHPGTGISPIRLDKIIGTKLNCDINVDTILKEEHLLFIEI
jgi:sialic acid synthase SpsE/SAM-dependent methyltransferase